MSLKEYSRVPKFPIHLYVFSQKEMYLNHLRMIILYNTFFWKLQRGLPSTPPTHTHTHTHTHIPILCPPNLLSLTILPPGNAFQGLPVHFPQEILSKLPIYISRKREHLSILWYNKSPFLYFKIY